MPFFLSHMQYNEKTKSTEKDLLAMERALYREFLVFLLFLATRALLVLVPAVKNLEYLKKAWGLSTERL